MLTFQFTGVSGKMTVAEKLTAGMVGKEVQFEFSEDWDGLRKVAVFEAGDISCTIVDVQDTDTIPAEALSVSLRRLYVGVYGISEDGSVVIPTVYATGPFIYIGTSSSGEGSDYDPEDPFWLEMENAVAETLRFTPQELTEEQKQQSRENIGAVKDNPETAELLMNILRNGVYLSDQSANIQKLASILTENVFWSIACRLENVQTDNKAESVAGNAPYAAVLSAQDGYYLTSVTVTMNGVDITDAVYTDGVITIAAVTGDVTITASAMAYITDIIYVPASFAGTQLNRYEYPSSRLSAVLTRVTADTPIPQNGNHGLGDLYLIPVPESASMLKVVSPGICCNPKLYALVDGTYTQILDVGWYEADEFTYSFTAGIYEYLVVNFRAPDNSSIFTSDYDTSGIRIILE